VLDGRETTMQTPPTSFEIHADAYRQPLLADAERLRSKQPRERRDRENARSSPGWLRRSAGTAVVRAGARLRGGLSGRAEPAAP
jgi:anti-sigma factor RsiW